MIDNQLFEVNFNSEGSTWSLINLSLLRQKDYWNIYLSFNVNLTQDVLVCFSVLGINRDKTSNSLKWCTLNDETVNAVNKYVLIKRFYKSEVNKQKQHY